MDASEEAKVILEAVKAGRFALRDHAIRRGDERLLSRDNVIHVAQTLLSWKYQEDKFSHWFIGFLDEGRTGGFAAIADGGDSAVVRVLTVFKRRLSQREREAFFSVTKLR